MTARAKPPEDEDSNLVRHAKAELEHAGCFDKTAMYGGMVGDAVLELIRVFAAQGHSGMSASIVRSLFAKVAAWEPLGPITSAPDEWMEVSTDTWQCRRNPSCFSSNGGRTYYDIDEKPPRWWIRRLFGRYKKMHQSAEPAK
jgi:hypothetical protein